MPIGVYVMFCTKWATKKSGQSLTVNHFRNAIHQGSINPTSSAKFKSAVLWDATPGVHRGMFVLTKLSIFNNFKSLTYFQHFSLRHVTLFPFWASQIILSYCVSQEVVVGCTVYNYQLP